MNSVDFRGHDRGQEVRVGRGRHYGRLRAPRRGADRGNAAPVDRGRVENPCPGRVDHPDLPGQPDGARSRRGRPGLAAARLPGVAADGWASMPSCRSAATTPRIPPARSKRRVSRRHHSHCPHPPRPSTTICPCPASTPTLGFETARHPRRATGDPPDASRSTRTTSRWWQLTASGRAAGHLALGIGKAAPAPRSPSSPRNSKKASTNSPSINLLRHPRRLDCQAASSSAAPAASQSSPRD